MAEGNDAREPIATAHGATAVATVPTLPHHRAMRSLSLLLFAAAAAAQVETPPAATPAPPATSQPSTAASQAPTVRSRPRPLPIDMVVATVNDSAILLSELRSVTLGTIRSLRASGRIVSPNDESLLLRRELKGLIDKRRLALSIHSMGIYTPEQIDGYVKSVLEQDRLEKQRDVGSMLGLSQTLKEEGRTWPTYEREQRLEKLSEFAEDATVRRRLGSSNGTLFLTPRMLRETYEREKAAFVHEAHWRVAMIEFTGPDAKDHAVGAAASWALQAMSAREMAATFPDARSLGETGDDGLADHLRPVAEFAQKGPAGAVSPPLEIRGAWYVARVLQYLPAENGRFEDPEVQARLRLALQNRVRTEFEKQAIERAEDRTVVWKSPNFTRGLD